MAPFIFNPNYMKVNGQLHAPTAFLLGKVPPYYWIGGWICPRVGVNAVKKRILGSYENATWRSCVVLWRIDDK
jgi:hypothetical protein